VALLDGIARYLDQLGLVEFDETGTTGDCFEEVMPDKPDSAVSLTLYGGPEPDSKLPYEEPRVQVRVRGGADPRVSRARAQAIYSALHGLDHETLPDGTFVVLCIAISTPASIGRDTNSRHEHVINFRCEITSVTAHRS
jgi:hypothetical protein